MKTIGRFLGIGVLLLLMAAPGASAQGGMLTLADALRTALAKNPTLLQAAYSAESAAVEVAKSEGALLPTVTASFDAGERLSGGGADPVDSASASVSARYNLYDGGALYRELMDLCRKMLENTPNADRRKSC